MSLEVWIAFVWASVLITLLPGPSMLLVISDAMTGGFRRALVTASGVVCADAVLLILSLLGVGAILAASAELFVIMKWAGAIFLIYLGINQLRSNPSYRATQPVNEETNQRLFAKGFVVTSLNPKIIGFFVAFFPQFIDETGEFWYQITIFAITFLTIVFIILLAYAASASKIIQVTKYQKVENLLARLSGATLIGAGALTAISSRQS